MGRFRIYLAGHSLGAAEACLYAYSRVTRGLPVDGLFLFGCPNPGDSVITARLKAVPLVRNFRNGRDLVTKVPVDLALLDEQYVPAAPYEHCLSVPPASDDWNIFSWHHIELYQKACKIVEQGPEVAISWIVDQVADMYSPAAQAPWDWLNAVPGAWVGLRRFAFGVLVVFRGSEIAIDWLHDFDALQIGLPGGARASAGFWDCVGKTEGKLDDLLR